MDLVIADIAKLFFESVQKCCPELGLSQCFGHFNGIERIADAHVSDNRFEKVVTICNVVDRPGLVNLGQVDFATVLTMSDKSCSVVSFLTAIITLVLYI